MPRIRAAEALKRIDELSIGSGLLKKHDQHSMLRQLRKEAGVKTTPQPVTKKTTASMGLGLKHV